MSWIKSRHVSAPGCQSRALPLRHGSCLATTEDFGGEENVFGWAAQTKERRGVEHTILRMNKINWSRVLGCGLLAGIVWIVLGAIVTALLGKNFAALPNNHLGRPTPAFIAANVIVDLLEGISILWLYAAIRPRYGPGARTAIIAAFAWWFIVSLGDVTWCSFGFFPASTVIPLMIGTIPAIILATLTGARFYKE